MASAAGGSGSVGESSLNGQRCYGVPVGPALHRKGIDLLLQAFASYLQVVEVFCFLTGQEGFGIAIAEAMAAGLQIASARLEGVTTELIGTEEQGQPATAL